MSWKATAWAKETTGHRGYASKLVLMVLADYHDDERGYAWPSQETLSRNCEMPLRTVRHALHQLEQSGFITQTQQGNQHQPSRYVFNFGSPVASAQVDEPAKSVPATIAAAPVPAISDTVYRQGDASVPATPVHTSLQEPPGEPPLLMDKDPGWVKMFLEDENPSTDRKSLDRLVAWVNDEGLQDYAADGVLSFVGRNRNIKRYQYSSPLKAVRTWIKNAKKFSGSNNTNNVKPKPKSQEDDMDERRREFAEYQASVAARAKRDGR
jgi:hypothetical protein